MEVGEKKVVAACKDMVKDAEYRAELRTIKKMCDTFPIGLTPGTCRYRLLGENGYCIVQFFQLVRRGHLAVRQDDEKDEHPGKDHPVRQAPREPSWLRGDDDGLEPTWRSRRGFRRSVRHGGGGRLPRPRGDGELGPGRSLGRRHGCAHTVRAPSGTLSGVRSRDPALGRSRCHPSAVEGKYISSLSSDSEKNVREMAIVK